MISGTLIKISKEKVVNVYFPKKLKEQVIKNIINGIGFILIVQNYNLYQY